MTETYENISRKKLLGIVDSGPILALVIVAFVHVFSGGGTSAGAVEYENLTPGNAYRMAVSRNAVETTGPQTGCEGKKNPLVTRGGGVRK